MLALARRTISALIGAVGVFAVDRFCKYFFFEQTHPFSLLGGFVQSIRHQNFGIAFNIPIPQWLILCVTFIACVGVLFVLVRRQHGKDLWFSFFLGLLLGGAIGNALDRLLLGFVRDWLLLWYHSAINVADLGVLIGLAGAAYLAQKTKEATPEA